MENETHLSTEWKPINEEKVLETMTSLFAFEWNASPFAGKLFPSWDKCAITYGLLCYFFLCAFDKLWKQTTKTQISLGNKLALRRLSSAILISLSSLS